ncbi:MAG: hypothetical protein HRT90_07495 [Candidatus Margulisbacteria bacterium]|nr:hypothetical protein [Candidatus Margulisiibacteriota bacterium]
MHKLISVKSKGSYSHFYQTMTKEQCMKDVPVDLINLISEFANYFDALFLRTPGLKEMACKCINVILLNDSKRKKLFEITNILELAYEEIFKFGSAPFLKEMQKSLFDSEIMLKLLKHIESGNAVETNIVDDASQEKRSINITLSNGDKSSADSNEIITISFKRLSFEAQDKKEKKIVGELRLSITNSLKIHTLFIRKDELDTLYGLVNDEGLYYGIGNYKTTHGITFIGRFENGSPKEGVVSYSSQYMTRYDGLLKYGMHHGHGNCAYKNGDHYNGNWKNDLRDDRGKMTYASGNVYEGEFKDGKQHGRGIKTWADGAVYDGEWENGKFQGRGKYVCTNGDVYDGEFREGVSHGNGTLTFTDGTVYEGQFYNDRMQGEGKLTVIGDPDNPYIGNFEETDIESSSEASYILTVTDSKTERVIAKFIKVKGENGFKKMVLGQV